jgi:hypothetical protein
VSLNPIAARSRLLAVLFAATLASSPALGAAMNVQLTFASLPSAQGFTYVTSGAHAGVLESNIFSVAGGVLTQNSMGQSNGISGGSILYEINGGITTTETKLLRVRARCLGIEGSANAPFGQQGFAFGFTTGSVQYDFGLTTSRIFILQPSGTVLLAGTYDNKQFHDYEFEFTPPSTTRLYRDGTLISTSTGGFAVAANRIFFGDGTGGANAQGEITRYQFIQDVATAGFSTTWGRVKRLYH